VVYYFFMIIGVFVVIASDTTQTYHVAVVGYLACGLVLTTSSVNGLVYSTNGAKEAAAAGFILLSMVTVRIFRQYPDVPLVRLMCLRGLRGGAVFAFSSFGTTR
jgi:hypothetical protein